MAETTYTITWHRPDGDVQVCAGLTPRVAFARLWAAVRGSGQITITGVVPESADWLESDGVNGDWPHDAPPPECEDAKTEGWTCVMFDGTGLWCEPCNRWLDEYGPELDAHMLKSKRTGR